MAPWLMSALVYGFLGAGLVFGLLKLIRRSKRASAARASVHSIGPAVALAAPLGLAWGGAGALLWFVLGALATYGLRGAFLAYPQQRLGRVARIGYTLASLALCALLATVIGQQGHSVVQDLYPDHRIWPGLLVGITLVLLAPLALAWRRCPPAWQTRLGWGALLAWIFLCSVALMGDLEAAQLALQEAWAQALDAASFVGAEPSESQSKLAAFLTMASAGIVAALWATQATAEGQTGPQPKKTNLSWLMTSIAVFCTGWMLLSLNAPQHQRIDDPELRVKPPKDDTPEHEAMLRSVASLATDTPSAPPRWLPLERPHVRSFAATSLGQSIVLPKDSPLSSNREYRILFRANPRGSRIGQLTPRGNGLFIPNPWQLLHKVQYIRFRDKNPKRNKNGVWDLRIPVNTRVLGSEASPRGVVLVPKNPALRLEELSERMDGPFVELEDLIATASPQRMHNTAIGVHDALLAPASHPDNTFAPSLREVVGKLGFRGPYLRGTPGEHPPVAMVAPEGFEGERNSQRELVYKTPPRGLDVGYLDVHGTLSTPPWEHLQTSKEIVFRHKSDPHLDLRIPVKGRLLGGRLRFYPESPRFNNLRELDRNPNYSGPYLMAPDYRFVVEVHGGEHLPDRRETKSEARGLQEGPLAARASLVPLHPLAEPVGGLTQLHRPHPAELSRTDAAGPFLAGGPSDWLLRTFSRSGLPLRGVARWVLLALFALGALRLSARSADQLGGLLGPGAAYAGPCLVLGGVLAGALNSWEPLAKALMLGFTLAFGAWLLLAVVSRLPPLAKRDPG